MCISAQQFQRVGQYLQYSLKRLNCSFWAARQIQNQAFSSNAADASAQCSQRSLSRAGSTHFLRNSLNHALHDRASGFRRNVSSGNTGASHSDHQVRLKAAIGKLLLDLLLFVREYRCPAYLESGRRQLRYNGWAGKVYTLSLKRRIADGENGGGIHSQASRTFSSSPRLDSSRRRRPSINRPWVVRLTVCSRLRPSKLISKLPAVHSNTLNTASSPLKLP